MSKIKSLWAKIKGLAGICSSWCQGRNISYMVFPASKIHPIPPCFKLWLLLSFLSLFLSLPPPLFFFVELEFQLRASHLLVRHSTAWAISPPLLSSLKGLCEHTEPSHMTQGNSPYLRTFTICKVLLPYKVAYSQAPQSKAQTPLGPLSSFPLGSRAEPWCISGYRLKVFKESKV
jgi:hypothetical protein